MKLTSNVLTSFLIVILLMLTILHLNIVNAASSTSTGPATASDGSESRISYSQPIATSHPSASAIAVINASSQDTPNNYRPSLILAINPDTIYAGELKTVVFTVTIESRCDAKPGMSCASSASSNPEISVDNVNIKLDGVASGSGTTNYDGQYVATINPSISGRITVTAHKDGYENTREFIDVIDRPYTPTIPPTPNTSTPDTPTPDTPTPDTPTPDTPTPDTPTIPPTPNTSTPNTSVPTPLPNTSVPTPLPNTSVPTPIPDTPTPTPTLTPTPTQNPPNPPQNQPQNPSQNPMSNPTPQCTENTINMENHNTIAGNNEMFGLDFTNTKKAWDVIWYVDNTQVSKDSNVNGITTYVANIPTAGKRVVKAVATYGCNKATYLFQWNVTPSSQPTQSRPTQQPTVTYTQSQPNTQPYPPSDMYNPVTNNQNQENRNQVEQFGAAIGQIIGSFFRGLFNGLFNHD